MSHSNTISHFFRKGKRQPKPDIGNEDLPKTGKPSKVRTMFKPPKTTTAITEAVKAPRSEDSSTRLGIPVNSKTPKTTTAITEAANAPRSEDSSTKLGSPANENSKTPRRQEAEKQFKDAVNDLQNVISKQKTSFQLQTVPKAISLQTVSPIQDVEGTARQLESFIEQYVATLGDLKRSQGKVKEFTKRWFMISFKYVKPVLNVAQVCVTLTIVFRF